MEPLGVSSRRGIVEAPGPAADQARAILNEQMFVLADADPAVHREMLHRFPGTKKLAKQRTKTIERKRRAAGAT